MKGAVKHQRPVLSPDGVRMRHEPRWEGTSIVAFESRQPCHAVAMPCHARSCSLAPNPRRTDRFIASDLVSTRAGSSLVDVALTCGRGSSVASELTAPRPSKPVARLAA